MSRALGDLVAHKEAGLSAEPDIFEVNLKSERTSFPKLALLVCTDGVWEFIPSKDAVGLVAQEIAAGKTYQVAVEKLTKEAYDRWMADSSDEITDDISGIFVSL